MASVVTTQRIGGSDSYDLQTRARCGSFDVPNAAKRGANMIKGLVPGRVCLGVGSVLDKVL